MESKTIVMHVDGGCSNPGKQGAKAYGSYLLQYKDQEPKRVGPFELPGVKDAPRAEYNTLIQALEYLQGLVERMKAANLQTEIYVVEIRMDNEMVVEQINGQRKVQKMATLNKQAMQLLEIARASFRKVNLVWIEGNLMKEILGH